MVPVYTRMQAEPRSPAKTGTQYRGHYTGSCLHLGLETLFLPITTRKSAKDICMWVSWVARLGYCSTQGLSSVTNWILSSPYRPWSMTCGGILSGNLAPSTGCPPWHQDPFFKHSGGLWTQVERIALHYTQQYFWRFVEHWYVRIKPFYSRHL